jgi:hypothetical protein
VDFGRDEEDALDGVGGEGEAGGGVGVHGCSFRAGMVVRLSLEVW